MKNFTSFFFLLLPFSILSLYTHAMDGVPTQEMDIIREEPFLRRIDSGVWTQVGKRHPVSEDTFVCEPIGSYFNNPCTTDYFFAVFDGHGGKTVSEYLKIYLKLFIVGAIGPDKDHNNIEKALKNAFKMADNNIRNIKRKGSTAIVALLIDDMLYIANAGDSRAIVYVEEKEKINMIITQDHKPGNTTERKRIEEAGGMVIFKQGADRVCGNLACSRSIGDHPKDPGLSAEPEILAVKLDKRCKFLIIASDGIYDVLSNEEAVYLAKKSINLSNAQKAAKVIVKEARAKDTPDDLTAIVVSFKWH